MLGFATCKQISFCRFGASAMSFTTYYIPDTFAEKQVGITPSPFLVNALIENNKHDFWAGTIQGLFRMNHEKRILERVFT